MISNIYFKRTPSYFFGENLRRLQLYVMNPILHITFSVRKRTYKSLHQFIYQSLQNTQSHALYPIYERLVLLYSSKNLFFDDPRRICLIVRARIKPIFEGSMFEPL